jgi:hypothetical protein
VLRDCEADVELIGEQSKMKPKLVYFESIDPFSSSIYDESAGEEAGEAGAGIWYDMGGAGWKVALAAVCVPCRGRAAVG